MKEVERTSSLRVAQEEGRVLDRQTAVAQEEGRVLDRQTAVAQEEGRVEVGEVWWDRQTAVVLATIAAVEQVQVWWDRQQAFAFAAMCTLYLAQTWAKLVAKLGRAEWNVVLVSAGQTFSAFLFCIFVSKNVFRSPLDFFTLLLEKDSAFKWSLFTLTEEICPRICQKTSGGDLLLNSLHSYQGWFGVVNARPRNWGILRAFMNVTDDWGVWNNVLIVAAAEHGFEDLVSLLMFSSSVNPFANNCRARRYAVKGGHNNIICILDAVELRPNRRGVKKEEEE